MIDRWRIYLRSLRLLLTPVRWSCKRCITPHDHPLLTWQQDRFHLICRGCGDAQDYPNHIKQFDPQPIPRRA